MADTAENTGAKVIVVPRPLEGYFYQRLRRRFAGRADIRIVVDRRIRDRRQPHWAVGPGPLADRRRAERRANSIAWSLEKMPLAGA